MLLTYSVKASVIENTFKVKKYTSIQLIGINWEIWKKTFFFNHSLKNSHMIELADALINYEMLLSLPVYTDSQKQWCFAHSLTPL